MGRELHSIIDGVKQDEHLHRDLLENQRAKERAALDAVEQAIRHGMTHRDAMQLYGHDLRLGETADVRNQHMEKTQRSGPTKHPEWWIRMNSQEQDEYLRTHPKSVMKKTAHGPVPPGGRLVAPPPGRDAKPQRTPQRTKTAVPPKDMPRIPTADGKHGGVSAPRPLGGASSHLVPADPHRDNWPQHIQALKLPPAWGNVHISHDPDADLQAIGKDQKGRSQYVYSEKYARSQAAAKFSRIQQLHQQYGQIQQQNHHDQKSEDPKTREHAQCMSLIMRMGLRPGSDEDTGAEKKAYGASTLTSDHVVKDEHGRTRLKFTGKKGVDLDLVVPDADTARMLHERARHAGPNQPLFPRVSGASLLEYAHGLGDGSFKTKDHRTYKGTSTAHKLVQDMPVPRDEKEYKLAVKKVAQHVSGILGNTPSVALSSYICPSAFAPWASAMKDHGAKSTETADERPNRPQPRSRLPQVHYGEVGRRAHPAIQDHDPDDDEMPRELPRSTIRLLRLDPRHVHDEDPK